MSDKKMTIKELEIMLKAMGYRDKWKRKADMFDKIVEEAEKYMERFEVCFKYLNLMEKRSTVAMNLVKDIADHENNERFK